MKILVRDEGQSAFGAIQLKIKDISSELERVTVRILRLGSFEKKILNINDITLRKPAKQRLPQKPKSIPAVDATSPAPAAPAAPVAQSDTRTVEVMVSLPSFSSLGPIYTKLKKRLSGASKWSLAIMAVLCVAIIAAAIYFVSWPIHSNASNSDATRATQPLTRGTPNYATILPTGKSAAQLGGWTRISPVNRDPVYAYLDKIGTVHITVSEQPLPANFMTDTATQVAQLAENFSATEKFTAGNTTVYIGTSAQGPQSVILTKHGLLILIKSTQVLTNNQWAAYVNTLQ